MGAPGRLNYKQLRRVPTLTISGMPQSDSTSSMYLTTSRMASSKSGGTLSRALQACKLGGSDTHNFSQFQNTLGPPIHIHPPTHPDNSNIQYSIPWELLVFSQHLGTNKGSHPAHRDDQGSQDVVGYLGPRLTSLLGFQCTAGWWGCSSAPPAIICCSRFCRACSRAFTSSTALDHIPRLRACTNGGS